MTPELIGPLPHTSRSNPHSPSERADTDRLDSRIIQSRRPGAAQVVFGSAHFPFILGKSLQLNTGFAFAAPTDSPPAIALQISDTLLRPRRLFIHRLQTCLLDTFSAPFLGYSLSPSAPQTEFDSAFTTTTSTSFSRTTPTSISTDHRSYSVPSLFTGYSLRPPHHRPSLCRPVKSSGGLSINQPPPSFNRSVRLFRI